MGVLLGGSVACLFWLGKVDTPGPADAHEDPIDIGRELGDERGVVGRAKRRPDPLGHVATDGAELRDETCKRGVWKSVVVADYGGGTPAELVVGVAAEAGPPLRPLRVEAAKVPRLDLQGRLLGAGDAVDENPVRLASLRVVGNRGCLVTGEEADQV